MCAQHFLDADTLDKQIEGAKTKTKKRKKKQKQNGNSRRRNENRKYNKQQQQQHFASIYFDVRPIYDFDDIFCRVKIKTDNIQWESVNNSFVQMNFTESNELNASRKQCLQLCLTVYAIAAPSFCCCCWFRIGTK